jgi:membrane protease YdiL (CAAX protease family)
VLSIAVLDKWLADNIFGWMPESLLEFARVEDDDEDVGTWAVVALGLIAIAFNGIAGPITEELYFRGHLLPRIERMGRRAPVLNTVLFAVYHFFSPWRYPAIIIGFLPITWIAWRNRSIFVSIGGHMAVNMVTVLLIVASLAAES